MTHVTPNSFQASIWTYYPPTPAETFFNSLAALLAATGVDLRSIPTSTVEPVATSLKALLRGSAQQPAAVLCLTERHDPALLAINQVCCAANVPLVLADPRTDDQSIGPGVVFGATPCLACLASHEQFFPFIRAATPGAAVAESEFVERLARELYIFTSSPDASLLRQGYLLRPSQTGGALSPSRILKDPACAVCSIAGRYPTEIVHTNQYKVEHAH